MIDYAAHRKILEWAVESGRMSFRERNFLLKNLSNAEWAAAQCAGKAAFKEFRDAELRARRGSFSHDIGMKPYLCPHCGLFHVGSKRPQVFRRAA